MTCLVVPGWLYHCARVAFDHSDEISITLWVLKGSYFGVFQRRYVHVHIVLHRSEYPRKEKRDILLVDEWISDGGYGAIKDQSMRKEFELHLLEDHADIYLFRWGKNLMVPFVGISEEHCNSTWMMFFYSFEQPDSSLEQSKYTFKQLTLPNTSPYNSAQNYQLAVHAMGYYNRNGAFVQPMFL